ncbi:phage DNA ejection protein [Morganella morganii]|nr:phage DNA ejection protein [Morganella morganii]
MAVVQPIDYTSGNGFAQGLQLKGLQDEIQQRAIAAEQAQIDRDNNAKFQQEWQQSFGDPGKMTSLAAKYPGQMDLIKSGIGFQNEQHQLALGNAARDLRVAIATNNPQAVQRVAVKHASVLNSVGSSPEEIMQQLQQDPGGLSRIVDTVGMSALGVKEYYDVAGAKETREETARSNRAGEALTARRDEQSNARGWAGISIQKQNADIARERLNLDRELKGLEYKEKALDRQVSKETNELKKAELEQKLDGIRTQKEAAKAERYDTVASQVDSADRAIKTAQSIINSPGFTGYFGVNVNPFGSRFLPGTDASDTSAMVDTLKSQGFMSGIQQMRGMGALSDAEGRKVMDAIGSLDSGMSEKQAKKSIEGIIETFEQGKKRLESRYPDEFSKYSGELNQSKYGLPIGHQEGGYTYKGGDPSDKNNWSK